MDFSAKEGELLSSMSSEEATVKRYINFSRISAENAIQ